MRGLTDALSEQVHAVLDRRLNARSAAPLAVGLSGGGDSRALTLMAAQWAAAHGRRLLVLSVDHQINPKSAAWTRDCAALAQRLGLGFRALAWEGEKPAQGLQAAARAARHRLLAQAAREAGASVVLLGHTADDLREAAAMRAAGSTTPSPREWAPSPAWPEGRGMFLLRPMLEIGRTELRAWLSERGERWIDDPSNDDLRFARARARAAGREGGAEPEALPEDLARRALEAAVDAGGVVSLPREGLPGRLVAAACLCAGGSSRPPRGERLARIASLIASKKDGVATLAGARIEAGEGVVRFMRELGRGGGAELTLEPGRPAVWDGRFELTADFPMSVAPLTGHAARLGEAEKRALAAIPAKARGALPAVIEQDAVRCPILAPVAGLSVRGLVRERLLAACGAVAREA
ncbi:tRNA lysidine(34) synthetase TilS [Phenylobacterium koreense]|uniref:tRNA(Ile)-lysidine synthase n=1 Tax=Phenylobacterium koreense TaxID=266125 RepID=A0ABV2EHK4_9CAUL